MLRGNRLGESCETILELAAPLAEAVVAGLQLTVRSVSLDVVTARLRGGIPGWPSYRDVVDLMPLEVAMPPQLEQSLVVERSQTTERYVEFLRHSSKLRLTREADKTIKAIVLSVWPELREREDVLASWMRDARRRSTRRSWIIEVETEGMANRSIVDEWDRSGAK